MWEENFKMIFKIYIGSNLFDCQGPFSFFGIRDDNKCMIFDLWLLCHSSSFFALCDGSKNFIKNDEVSNQFNPKKSRRK